MVTLRERAATSLFGIHWYRTTGSGAAGLYCPRGFWFLGGAMVNAIVLVTSMGMLVFWLWHVLALLIDYDGPLLWRESRW